MKKSLLILIVVFALAIAGCQTNPTPEETDAAEQTEQVTDGTPYPEPTEMVQNEEAYPVPEGMDTAEEISWEEAQELIKNGEVAEVVQTHAMEVLLRLKDGRSLKTVEPAIDDIFTVIQQCGSPCGDILIATE